MACLVAGRRLALRGKEGAMRKLVMGLLGGWLAVSAPAHAFAHEHEQGQPTTMTDVPAAVKTTFDKESKGGKVEELRKETTKDGRTFYWGEVVKGGKGTELKVDDSGKVVHRGKAHDESMEKGEKGEMQPH
jgi:hypothetical protein